MKKRLVKKKKKVPNGKTKQLFALLTLYAVFLLMAALCSMVGQVTVSEIDRISSSLPSPVSEKSEFQMVLENMVDGFPIETMVPAIATRDPLTATFLVSIAKKESNWGKYSPKDENGRECWNYWGYRGKTEYVTSSGYSCFRSPRQAVSVVGARLDTLIYDMKLDTAEKLIVWKCGWSCEGHSGVEKWKQDVGYYVSKINRETELQ